MDKIKTVAIIGMGLIGGSLGMAIKNKDLAEKVIGVSRNADHLKEAKAKEALDEFTIDPIEASRDADLVFVTTPIRTIVPIVKTIFPVVKKGCIITDVGSSKLEIVGELESISPEGIFFIGGHPMAGSERSGIKAATKFLFEGTNYCLTPTGKTDKEALKKLIAFIENFDVRISVIPPDLHDIAVAGISHMPLAVAASLVNMVCDMKEAKTEMLALASSGFRDTTRIAAGSVEMGRDMFTTNKKAVLKMIKEFKASLEKIEAVIEEGDAEKITAELEKAKKLRTDMYAA
ncbi:MAG: prephenate dehydrogenase/arogenate dehydrogenase family protein [Candidatus Saganbacteria bacterium]|nr:prephenate dehydrogenase/arogenate dehydrogenase family protein [Candidatus Saganbacteria bacterium]